MKYAKKEDVIKRIQEVVRNPNIRTRLVRKVEEGKDLTIPESGIVYEDVDFGDERSLSKKKKLDIDWTNHAEYRSELRDVDHEMLNDNVENKLRERYLKDPKKHKKEEIKTNRGVAVVDYDFKSNPAEAEVVTTWASKRGNKNMDIIRGENGNVTIGKDRFGKIRIMYGGHDLTSPDWTTTRGISFENMEEAKEWYEINNKSIKEEVNKIDKNKELKFGSYEDAMIHLANITGEKVVVTEKESFKALNEAKNIVKSGGKVSEELVNKICEDVYNAENYAELLLKYNKEFAPNNVLNAFVSNKNALNMYIDSVFMNKIDIKYMPPILIKSIIQDPKRSFSFLFRAKKENQGQNIPKEIIRTVAEDVVIAEMFIKDYLGYNVF